VSWTGNRGFADTDAAMITCGFPTINRSAQRRAAGEGLARPITCQVCAGHHANPSSTMAELSGVALSTAQGWVAKARTRGLLPPGRRGRAG
jgi:hypothetical protein